MRLGFLHRPAFQHSLAGKANAAGRVNVRHHHGDFITHPNHVFHTAHRLGIQLGDMHHPIGVGQNFHESAEIGHPHHLAGVDAPHLRGFGQRLDALTRLRRAGHVGRGNVNQAVFHDVDLGVGFLLQAADGLTAGADDGANFVHRNADDDHVRRMRLQVRARLGNDFPHLAKDEQAGFPRLRQGLAHDFFGDARDLDVHLQGGNALFGARDFEIHVAEVVFHALDVGQHGILLAFLDEAHRDARHRGFDGHAGVHQGKGGAAHGSHRGGAVGGKHLGNQPQRIGEFLFRGDDRQQGALGQRTVADFTAGSAAHRAHFAHREGREVVVVDVALAFGGGQAVDFLRFARGAQRSQGEHLGFAAGEQPGAVGAGADVHLAPDGADVGSAAAIGADAFVENAAAHDFLEHVFESHLDGQGLRGIFAREGFHHLFLQRVNAIVELGFGVRGFQQLPNPVGNHALNLLHQAFFHHKGRIGALGLAQFGSHLFLNVNHRLQRLMAKGQGFHHHLFRHFARPGFHHQNGIASAGNAQVEGRLFQFGEGGVDHKLAVNVANAHRAHRAMPGDVGNHQRGRGSVDGKDVDGVFFVGRDGIKHHLDVVPQVFGKERAQRAVDQAGGEGGFLGRAAFAAEERAGDAPTGVHALFVVHPQREKVNAFAGFFAHGRRGKHHGVAQADGDGTVGLHRQLAGFDDDGFVANHGFVTVVLGFHRTSIGRPSGQGLESTANEVGRRLQFPTGGQVKGFYNKGKPGR